MALHLPKRACGRKLLARTAALRPFFGKNLAHGRPCTDPLAMLMHLGESPRIDAVAFQPARQGEEIAVADGIGIAQHPGALEELVLDELETGGLGLWNLAGHFGLRSEEHTSELQSLMRISYAVFCLKKKKLTK